MVAITRVAASVVGHLYNPSKRYMAANRRGMISTSKTSISGVSTRIHSEENVHPTIILVEASNPSNSSPTSMFVLHLRELCARAMSDAKPCRQSVKGSKHIINAFRS